MPNSVSDLNQTPIFEWYVVWCGSTKDNKKVPCVQKRLSYVHIIGGMHMTI